MSEPTTNAAIRKRYENGRLLADIAATAAATPGFGAWRQIDADRAALLTVEATAETDGAADGEVLLDVDEDGDGAAEYTLTIVRAPLDAGAGVNMSDAVTSLQLPAGAQYQVRNASDPNAVNAIDTVREVTL